MTKVPITTNAKHLYQKTLRGEAKLARVVIPSFYDIKRPFPPYTQETRQMPLSELDPEDPEKVGSVPEKLLDVLTFASGRNFNSRKLEYSTVREAYDRERKRPVVKLSDKILATVGTMSMLGGGFFGGSGETCAGMVAISTGLPIFTIGFFGLLGIFDNKIPKDLEEFAKLNEVADQADNYLGNIDVRYLNQNLFRDDYSEHF
ncbi:MAG: hypothetical protein AABX23_04340 [Nanoarchaeota archaeon]